MHAPTVRNVTILITLVTAVLIAGCGSKSDATAAATKSDAKKGDAPKAAEAAKPGEAPKPGTPAPAPAAKPGLPVKAETVTILKVLDDVSAVGSLLAEESVIIRPEIDGRIVGLHFKEGQAVTAGSRLVTFGRCPRRETVVILRFRDLGTAVARFFILTC